MRLTKLLGVLLLFGLSVAAAQCQWPASGAVSSVSGPRTPPCEGCSSYHQGIDIAAFTGDPVGAACGGTIEYRQQTDPDTGELSGYGNYAIVYHDDGTTSLYGHLSEFNPNLSNGDRVGPGDLIGNVGNSGSGTGPHLHFSFAGSDPFGDQVKVNGENWDVTALAGLQQTRYGGREVPFVASGTGINAPGYSTANANANPGNTNPGNANPGNANPGNANPGNANPDSTDPDNVSFDPNASPYDAEILPDGTTVGEGGIPSVPKIGSSVDDELTSFEAGLKNLLPTPDKWIEETGRKLGSEGFNITAGLRSLAIALLFASFVYSIVNANYFYRSDQYFFIIGRLIIASGLILGSSAIGTGLMSGWSSIYQWMNAEVVTPATDELRTQILTLAPGLTTFATATAAFELTASIAPETFGLDAVEELSKNMAGVSRKATIALGTIMFLMGGLYGTYFLSVYISGMTMMLAGILLPILAAFLVLPGSASWFMRWFNMIVLSLVTVTILPLFLNLAITFGMNGPIQEVNETNNQIVEQMNAFAAVANQNPIDKAANSGKGLIGSFKEATKGWGTYFEVAGESFKNIGDNMVILLFRWVFALVLSGIMILALAYLLQQLPGIISSIIGGSAGGTADAGGIATAAGIAIGGAAASAGALGGTMTKDGVKGAGAGAKALGSGTAKLAKGGRSLAESAYDSRKLRAQAMNRRGSSTSS